MKIIENKVLKIFKDFFGKKYHLHSDVLSKILAAATLKWITQSVQ